MLIRMINRALERHEALNRRREALKLARLEDYLLADIGLSRHQINHMLAGTGENPF